MLHKKSCESRVINNMGFSQTSLLNEAKYWVWRDRLVNDFMVPNYSGDYAHKGRGVIFKSRGIGECDYNDLTSNSIIRIDGGFDISDEGFELGKYLIVLATEWRLLYNSNLSTSQNEAEIYWALKTIDRLDYDAEIYWSYFWSKGLETWGGQKNGFMIRDDVKRNFLWYLPIFPTGVNNLDNNYFNSLINIYNTVPSYFTYNNDSYQNYLYLNQGLGNNKGKYFDKNIMISKIDNSRILSLHESMVWLRSIPGGVGFSAFEAKDRKSTRLNSSH